MSKGVWGFAGEGRHLLLGAVFLAACGAASEDESGSPGATAVAAEEAKAKPEDGLADAFDTFVSTFQGLDFDANYRIGYGPHQGFATDTQRTNGGLAAGQAVIEMNTGRVTATLVNVPDSGSYELWFVKNAPGGTVLPERRDSMLKVGTFSDANPNERPFRILEVTIDSGVLFDLDQVVVTPAGKKPHEKLVAVGDRTLLEKRLFRFRQGQTLDPVSGARANDIETTDPLVARGAELFFNETFGGNGRTCGTCHRADNNLTIDPAFIATLPPNDPLFVAETNPELAQLENPALLRSRGLILENLDGFADPTNQFVMRSVPHTLSLGLTNGIGSGFFTPFGTLSPPDHRLGWSGDGGPGRSTLHEFTFGAIMQHFTKTLARRPGVDFRVPTEEELDALEAFQLFTGRQKSTDLGTLFPADTRAQNGQNLFNSVGCTFCHTDLSGTDFFGLNFDTGVSNLTPDLVDDDGLGTPGDRTFNAPPLVEAADTGPFFHNNAIDTIEGAVGFYFSPTFQASPSSFFIFSELDVEAQGDIAAFLRVINSAANIDQVRRRVEYIKNVRSSGNTALLKIAVADTEDAMRVLSERDLSADVQAQLSSANTLLENAQTARDRDRPAIMTSVLALLDDARAALFTTPPDGGGGFGGSMGTGGSFSGGSGPILAGAPSSGGSGSIAGTSPVPDPTPAGGSTP